MGNRGFEIEGVPGIEDIVTVLGSELECSLQDVEEFFALMAEIRYLIEPFPLELNEKRLHIFFRFFEGEGFVIITALFPSEVPGIHDLALITLHEDDFLFGLAVLKEKADVHVEGLRDLEQGGDGGRNQLFFDLGKKRLGKARSVGEVLKDKAGLLPEFSDLLADMKLPDLMLDIFRNHVSLLNPFKTFVNGFFSIV
jgi:hypothetical protein